MVVLTIYRQCRGRRAALGNSGANQRRADEKRRIYPAAFQLEHNRFRIHNRDGTRVQMPAVPAPTLQRNL